MGARTFTLCRVVAPEHHPEGFYEVCAIIANRHVEPHEAVHTAAERGKLIPACTDGHKHVVVINVVIIPQRQCALCSAGSRYEDKNMPCT